MPSRFAKAVRIAAAALGLDVATVRCKKHLVVRVSDTAGRSRLVVVARTPSDYRATANMRGELRRAARVLGCGV